MKKCLVDECSRVAYAKNMCEMHYRRVLTNGTISLKRSTQNLAQTRLLNKVMAHKRKTKCLPWPYSRTKGGCATISYKGKYQRVPRIICRRVHGKPPTPKHEACHSCGKGHEGCVNPWHLYWGTHTENMADKIKHGTNYEGERHVSSKLNNIKVKNIRRLQKRGYKDAQLARLYGVGVSAIRDIRVNKTWKHLL